MKISSVFLSQSKDFKTDKKEYEERIKLADQAFIRIKKRTGYFPLEKVSFSRNIALSKMDMDNFEILINPDYIEDLSKYMLTSQAIEAVIELETGNYLYHPHSFFRLIIQKQALSKSVYQEKALNQYNFINKSLRIIATSGSETKITELFKITPLYSLSDMIIRELLLELTTFDFGTLNRKKLDPEKEHLIETTVNALKRINFLNLDKNKSFELVKTSEEKNIKDLLEFNYIMKKAYKLEEDKTGHDYQNPDPSSFNSKEIENDIQKILNDHILNKEQLINNLEQYVSKGGGDLSGSDFNENPALEANFIIYKALAEKQKIKLESSPLVTSKGIYPYTHTKFEISDPLEDLDILNSFGGKILPGISNKWQRKQIKFHGKVKHLRDLIIFIDDSSSMPDPLKDTSYPVVSSLSIAREYLLNKVKVAACRFSDRTVWQDFSLSFKKIGKFLLYYQSGHATKLDLKVVEDKILSKKSDLIFITDSKIKNISEIQDFLTSNKRKIGRIYFIHINNRFNEIRETIQENIKFIEVGNKESLSSIILNDIFS